MTSYFVYNLLSGAVTAHSGNTVESQKRPLGVSWDTSLTPRKQVKKRSSTISENSTKLPPLQSLIRSLLCVSIQAVKAVPAMPLLCPLLFLICLNIHAADLKIAVAANFRHPLEILAKDYQAKHSHIGMQIVTGVSSELAMLVSDNRQNFDLFLSADNTQPEQLEKDGLIVENSRNTYAQGKLVLWHQQPERIDCRKIQTYLTEHLPVTIIADPEKAPYGQRAVEAMKAMHVYATLNEQGLIKTSHNVHDAWNTVNTGNATVGFVALSLLLGDSADNGDSGHLHGDVEADHFTEVPQELYTPLKQQMVILKSSDHPEEAKHFADFLLSPEVQHKIASLGYDSAPESAGSHLKQHSTPPPSIPEILGAVTGVAVIAGVGILAVYCVLKYRQRASGWSGSEVSYTPA